MITAIDAILPNCSLALGDIVASTCTDMISATIARPADGTFFEFTRANTPANSPSSAAAFAVWPTSSVHPASEPRQPSAAQIATAFAAVSPSARRAASERRARGEQRLVRDHPHDHGRAEHVADGREHDTADGCDRHVARRVLDDAGRYRCTLDADERPQREVQRRADRAEAVGARHVPAGEVHVLAEPEPAEHGHPEDRHEREDRRDRLHAADDVRPEDVRVREQPDHESARGRTRAGPSGPGRNA